MPGNKKIRVIIDSSWWISMIVSKKSFGLPLFLRSEEFQVCFSKELKEEIFEALTYLRNKKRINKLNFKTFADLINEVAIYFEIKSTITVCRDPEDNFLLSLAKDAQAGYLITNDPDLLSIQKFEQTIICTLPHFIDKYLK